MDSFGGRRRKGRQKIKYDDVVPSTDLPPLVEGELRCFVCVTVGKLVWGSTASARIPPISPAYIRLRWWGEATNGTLFRPLIQKDERISVKSRAQFGIRSGPKQMAAYFNDMGSATFDVLSSPNSLPIGRVQVPGVSSLSSSNPIRGFFPVISASSRKLGELQISISFKPVKAAYDDSTDAMTDVSFSARSRNVSFGGSRRSSLSRHSSVGSNRSRSSSRGSRKGRSRSNSNGSYRKQNHARGKNRSRSGSNDSKTSTASQGSKSKNNYNDEEPSASLTTPRGIDALLEENGVNLYNLSQKQPKKKEKSVQIVTTVSSTKPTESVHFDAIKELLKRGKQLREEITHSTNPSHNIAESPPKYQAPVDVPISREQQTSKYTPPLKSVAVTTVTQSSAYSTKPSLAVTEHKSDTDLRIVDMFLRGKGMKNEYTNTPDFSGFSSSMCSVVSDTDDPLHDESIIQHLFYDQKKNASNNGETLPKKTTIHQSPPRPVILPSALCGERDNEMGNPQLACVSAARVSIHNLKLNKLLDSGDELSGNNYPKFPGQRKDGKLKPPMPQITTSKKQKGTFFVEYKFPSAAKLHRSIAATSSSHEMTRVASRKSTSDGTVKFDEHSVFNIKFNDATTNMWSSESMDFVVYHRKPKNKKATLLATATLPLRLVLQDPNLSFSENIELTSLCEDDGLADVKICGTLKVSLDLVDEVKSSSVQAPSVKKKRSIIDNEVSVVANKESALEDRDADAQLAVENTVPKQVATGPRVCIAASAPASPKPRDADVCPRIASQILYLYVVLGEAKDIPATRLKSDTKEGKCSLPNVYLVCRTFASDEASKTRVIWNTSNPSFGFSQVLPIKINTELFTRMRDNYVVVEVWTKIPSESKFTEKLMGLVKVPLHLFHQSLKDPDIARAVLKSEYPLVSVDGFQPIVDVFSGHERGKLQILLALGTQAQVNALRKAKESDDRSCMYDEHHLDDTCRDTDESVDGGGPEQHTFQLTIRCLRGFKPLNNQVWGETDCFIQYSFPAQRQSKECEPQSNDFCTVEENLNLATFQSYRTDTTLCVPNPQFKFTKKHCFRPPSCVPVQRLLLAACSGSSKSSGEGIPFEIWSRYYYPNARDQLLARGSLPIAKLCALVTMKKAKVSQQTFQVPLQFIDADPGVKSAGDLCVSVKYYSSGSTTECQQPPAEFNKIVKLQVSVLRACGLKAAAKLASSLMNDPDIDYCSKIGVNSYVVLKTTFLSNENDRQTRCIAQSFAPDYNNHFELTCPLVSYRESFAPISLAELFASGNIQLEIWHKPNAENESFKSKAGGDVLLGRAKVSTCELLTRTTGCNDWYSITSLESLQHKSTTTVGAIELSMSLSCRNDLDLILRSAKAAAWKPSFKSDLHYLLTPDTTGVLKPVDVADTSEDHVTACITVTNAWLPIYQVLAPGTEEISKHTHVYIHYKFFDKDSVTSSQCPVNETNERKTFENHDVMPVKLAHRKSFLCKPTQPLVWYLREEMLEVQLWLSRSRSGCSRKRPLDSDRLLGSARINMSPILVGGLHKQQHISGLYSLVKAGVDDIGDAAIRVYFSFSPGDNTRPFGCDDLDDSSTTASCYDPVITSDKQSGIPDENDLIPKKDDTDSFSAIVSVERAMHLPRMAASSDVSSQQTDHNEHARPSCYVTYPVAGDEKNAETTKVMLGSSCPVWNDAKEVRLDKKFLCKDGSNLLFRVWHRDVDESENVAVDSERMTCDRMIGFATVDISVLVAGFRAVNGWYNILDIHGNCQGQIKVAVTPTETVYANDETICKEEAARATTSSRSPDKGILHSVPLLGPVETPSGSMYSPGILSFAQKAGSFGQTGSDAHIKPPQSSFLKPSQGALSAPPVLPSRAMFKHDEKLSLLDTLQRQMDELDRIKKNFQEKAFAMKLAAGIDEVEKSPSVVLTDTSKVQSKHNQVPVVSSRVDIEPTDSNEENFALRDFRQDFALDTSSPASSKKPTVHMSLFKPEKNTLGDDGTALSDNELSDVEFVCPKNLNGQSVIFADGIKDGPSRDIGSGSTKDESSSSEVESVTDTSLNETQLDQIGTNGSELNNTSLWLSGSASLIEDTSQDIHQQDEEDETNVKVLRVRKKDVRELDSSDLLPNASNKLESNSTEEVGRVIDQPSRNDQNESSTDDDTETISEAVKPSETFSLLETEESLREEEKEEATVNESASEQEDVDEQVDAVQDQFDDPTETRNDGFSTELTPEVKRDEIKEELDELSQSGEAIPDLSHPDNDTTGKEKDSENTSVPVAPVNIMDEGGSRYLVEVETDACPTLTESSSSLSACPVCQVSLSSTTSCDSITTSSAPHSSAGVRQFPSFFPPRQDLLASMRALQAITTEQKHKLLKHDSCENKENSVVVANTSPIQKSRRKPEKPSSLSTEKTKRLARIFNTKYTSS